MNSVQFDARANNEVKIKQILGGVGITIHGFNNHPFGVVAFAHDSPLDFYLYRVGTANVPTLPGWIYSQHPAIAFVE